MTPGWETYRLHCLHCRHQFTGWLPTGCPIPVWIAAAQALYCPNCGVGYDRIGLDLETATTEEP